MQTSKAPPTRNSTRASGTVYAAGQNQRLRCSAEPHARNTSSRGAGNTREITNGCDCATGILFTTAMNWSLHLESAQVLAETVEAPLPLQPPLIDPLFRQVERLGLDPASAHASDFPGAHQTRVLEHRQMLHDSRQRHGQR